VIPGCNRWVVKVRGLTFWCQRNRWHTGTCLYSGPLPVTWVQDETHDGEAQRFWLLPRPAINSRAHITFPPIRTDLVVAEADTWPIETLQ
jgi:hypothetical protein